MKKGAEQLQQLQLHHDDEKPTTEAEEHDRIRSLIEDLMDDINEMDEFEDRSSLGILNNYFSGVTLLFKHPKNPMLQFWIQIVITKHLQVKFSEKGAKIPPQTHIRQFEIIHFSDNISTNEVFFQ